MDRKQPSDEWTFLRPDEWLDDKGRAWAEAPGERGPEELAMHVTSLTNRAVDDPGRADVDTQVSGPSADESVTYFDDEEPETITAEVDPAEDADEEPDLEDILESQHYAFQPPEP